MILSLTALVVAIWVFIKIELEAKRREDYFQWQLKHDPKYQWIRDMKKREDS